MTCGRRSSSERCFPVSNYSVRRDAAMAELVCDLCGRVALQMPDGSSAIVGFEDGMCVVSQVDTPEDAVLETRLRVTSPIGVDDLIRRGRLPDAIGASSSMLGSALEELLAGIARYARPERELLMDSERLMLSTRLLLDRTVRAAPLVMARDERISRFGPSLDGSAIVLHVPPAGLRAVFRFGRRRSRSEAADRSPVAVLRMSDPATANAYLGRRLGTFEDVMGGVERWGQVALIDKLELVLDRTSEYLG